MKKLISLLLVVFASSITLLAQSSSGWCHAHSMSGTFLQNNPQYQAEKLELEKARKHYTQAHRYAGNKTTEPIITIPVVFHIVHEYGPENISYQTVLNTIELTNDAFRKRSSDTALIQPPYNEIHPDTRIQLKLAKIDPNGNCTQGVNRIYSPQHTNAGSDDMKSFVAPTWDRSKYLNVWVVKTIASGAGGYSFTPPINATSDGIVILAGQLSSLTHELGHYLGLNHPWGPTNDPNMASNCGYDDNIDDTPNTIGATSCGNKTPNSCPGDDIPFLKMDGSVLWPASSGEIHDNVQNYMGYAFCSAENFTEGQMIAMRGTLNTYAPRINMWTEANLIATGTTDTSTFGACIPKADFLFDVSSICQNSSVTFTNLTYNAAVDSYLWDFGDGTTSTDVHPIHQYTTNGTFTVTLTATNTYGSDQKIKTSIVTVKPTSGGDIAPLYQGFEEGTFLTTTGTPKDWTILSTTSTTFSPNSLASASGDQSLAVRLASMAGGNVVELISPTIDFTNANCFDLKFKYAYAQQYQASPGDELAIYASKNCGEKWIKIYSQSGANLSTTGGNFIGGSFIPDSSQWLESTVSLASYAGRSHILLKFELTTDAGGNYFYLDDVNIGCASPTGISPSQLSTFSIWPNPFDHTATLKIDANHAESTQLTITNSVGQQVYWEQIWLNAGKNELQPEILGKLEKGVYFVTLKINQGLVTRKLIKF